MVWLRRLGAVTLSLMALCGARPGARAEVAPAAEAAPCPTGHELQAWRPLQTTSHPVLSHLCKSSDCVSVRPKTVVLRGCRVDSNACIPRVVRPRVETADKAQQAAVQRALDRVYAQWKGDNDDCWMEYFDYTIHHDANQILDITFRASGLGAYPWTHTAHITLDLRTARALVPKLAFDSKRLRALAQVVDKKLQAAIKAGPADAVDCCAGERWSPGQDDVVPSFTANTLGDFMVTPRGLVFFYDFGIPHVIQVLTPKSEYLLTPRELAPYIVRQGPLGWLQESK